MTTSRSSAVLVCGEQDCGERTGRPEHPLCYPHWLDSQNGVINECPNCSGVYKPSAFPQCRSCGNKARTGARPQSQADGRGWNRQPVAEAKPVPRQAVEAAGLVRRNMTAHERSCVNNEANTIQFLIMPMLKGLGWNDDDPEQVVREYKPTGKLRFRRSMAVDIALLDNGHPKVFVEAKRLDREYDPEYADQLDKYAAYLDDGDAAVLTNGRHWLIHTVSNGETRHNLTIDAADGDAESVVAALNNVIGRDAVCSSGGGVGRGVASVSGQYRTRPEGAAPRRDPGKIAESLRAYRERESNRRRQPAYIILKDEAISLIAEHQPDNMDQLGKIKGVGPSTLEQHGKNIIEVVRAS